MTYPTEMARKRNSKAVVATVRLARWQLRAAWGLLVMTGIGIVAAVMLVCAVPLYTNVAMSAGLRGVLTASPQNTVIVVRSNSLRVSAQYISKVGRHLDQELEKNLGPYLGSPQFSIETKPFLIPGSKATKGLHVTNEIGLISASMDQAASHVKLLAGRLPRTSSGGLELAITPESALALHKTVGSLLTVSVTFTDAPLWTVALLGAYLNSDAVNLSAAAPGAAAPGAVACAFATS